MNTMGIFPMFPFWSIIHRFWLPTLFIGIGVMLLSRRGASNGGLFFILFGVLFLLGGLNVWGDGDYRRWIGPGILIWIGLAFLLRNPNGPRRMRRERIRAEGTPGESDPAWKKNIGVQESTDSSDFIYVSAILGGFNRKCPSQQFRGGDLTAIMGGGKLDLREARIQDAGAVLDVFALMGGMEIVVPRDWVVEARLTPVLGGIEDITTPDRQSSTQRLVIKGTAIMGGVKVHN
jgi:Cell wall-active antibiotics response 4TMS YvqF